MQVGGNGIDRALQCDLEHLSFDNAPTSSANPKNAAINHLHIYLLSTGGVQCGGVNS